MASKRANKEMMIKARVSPALKRQVDQLARFRDENESVIVRAAMREYLRRHKNGN